MNKETKQELLYTTLRLFKGYYSESGSSLLDSFNNVEENKEYSELKMDAYLSGVSIELLSLGVLPIEEARDVVRASKTLYGLSSKELNSALFKSFEDVKNATKEELDLVKFANYMTTYGAIPSSFETFQAYEPEDIPSELLDNDNPLGKSLNHISLMSRKEIVDRFNEMVESGVALGEQDLSDLSALVDILNIKVDVDKIKNKEFMCMMIDKTRIVPKNPSEAVRYLIYILTGNTLLIKSKEVINTIKMGGERDRVVVFLKSYSHESLATVFNRFKPIFLAIKKSHPRLKSDINHISRLSKELHKPMEKDILTNFVHGRFDLDDIEKAIEKANTYQLTKTANALWLSAARAEHGEPINVLYQIRNGKSFQTEKDFSHLNNADFITQVQAKGFMIMDEIVSRVKKNVGDKAVIITDGVDLALPTTLKTSTGFIPQYTRIKADSEDLLIGITWEEQVDIDLSCTTATKEISWFSSQNSGGLTHSGDMTRLNRHGIATEYVLMDKDSKEDAMFSETLYSSHYGQDYVDYKVIIGSKGANKKNTEDVKGLAEIGDIKFVANMKSEYKSKAIGLFDSDNKEFILASTTLRGLNPSMVSHEGVKQSMQSIKMTAGSALTLNDVLAMAGIKTYNNEEELDGKEFLDFRLEGLTKDSFYDIMK